MLRSILVLSLLAVLALAPACAAVVAGAAAAGTVQYLRNEATRTYPATVEATWSATMEALRDSGYPVDPSTPYRGASDGTFEIEDVKVEVLAAGENATRVTVRVGTFDTDENRETAQRIQDAIARRLGV